MTCYRSFVNRFDEAVRKLRARSECGKCAAGCCDCCRTRSVLPVEALPLLDRLLRRRFAPPAGDRTDACPFLGREGTCGLGEAQPSVCRTHGLPILYLNPDGAWASNGCPREEPHLVSVLESDGVFPLHVWNAELHRINIEFCGTFGLPARRIPLEELARNPQAYLPLLERIPERERRIWEPYPAASPVLAAPPSS